MKELRHIRRARERWQDRRAARAAWWAEKDEPPFPATPLQEYAYRMHRDYVRKELGLIP